MCTIIKEFGKKSDLASAVKVFEASRQKFGGHNMYVYRTIIDACGLCGDCFKSRLIFEVASSTDFWICSAMFLHLIHFLYDGRCNPLVHLTGDVVHL